MVSSTHRSTTSKTAIPASAVRLAAGSLTPRRRNTSASAAASAASFHQLAFSQFSIGGNDGLALSGVTTALLEKGGHGVERGGHGLDQQAVQSGTPATAFTKNLLQGAHAAEDLALVGEVSEERPFGQSGAGGDLGNGGVLESPFAVKGEGRLFQPAAAVRLPTAPSTNPSRR